MAWTSYAHLKQIFQQPQMWGYDDFLSLSCLYGEGIWVSPQNIYVVTFSSLMACCLKCLMIFYAFLIVASVL